MSTKVEAGGGLPDALKGAVAFVLLAAGTGAFYYFAEYSLLYRVIGLLVLAGVALAVAAQTEKGRTALGFMRDSRTEVRKVVWPTRKETLQTTGMVIVVVIVVALFLWMLDGILAWAVGRLLGWGD